MERTRVSPLTSNNVNIRLLFLELLRTDLPELHVVYRRLLPVRLNEHVRTDLSEHLLQEQLRNLCELRRLQPVQYR